MSAQSILVNGTIEAKCIAATTPNFSIDALTCTSINTYPLTKQWIAAGNVSTIRNDITGRNDATVSVGAGAPPQFALVVTPSSAMNGTPNAYLSNFASPNITFSTNGDFPGQYYNWAAFPYTY